MTKSITLVSMLSLFLVSSCQKADETIFNVEEAKVKAPAYKVFTIQQGQHFCDQNILSFTTVSSVMRFNARFDQSAVYTTVDPVNQYDINKLWGFSEGSNHQYNSARIGWAYNDGALRLFGYAYVNGLRHSVQITSVPIGAQIPCSIELVGNSYVFTVNGVKATLPRASSTTRTSGYKLYSYFGGDEAAPQLIRIEIMENP